MRMISLQEAGEQDQENAQEGTSEKTIFVLHLLFNFLPSHSPLLSAQAAANGNHMKETQVRSHSKMFLDVWQEYNNSQLDFRDKRRKQGR